MKKRKGHKKKAMRHDDTGSNLSVVPESEEEDLEEDRSNTSQPDSTSNSLADEDDADSLDEVIMIAVQMDDVGASVPTAEEMHMDGEHRRGNVISDIAKPLLGRRYVRYAFGFLGFLIVLVLISMTVSNNKKQAHSVEISSDNAPYPPPSSNSSSLFPYNKSISMIFCSSSN